MWPRLANVALGIWLMAAPAVLGYSTVAPVAAGSDRILGPLIVSAAIVAIWPEVRPLRWVNVVLGALAVVAPIAVGPFVTWPLAAVINSIVVGLVVMAFGSVRGPVDTRFGGGWRSIWRSDIDTVTGSRR